MMSLKKGCLCLCLALAVLLTCLFFPSVLAEEAEAAPEYDLISGKYQGGYTQKFVYSDSMLLEDAAAGVHPEIVKLSVSLSGAAYQPEYINGMLDQMGYSADNFQYTERNISYNDLVAYTLGMRTIPGTSKKVFILAIRGTSANAEWFSNFNVGASESGEHRGFHLAAKNVYATITSAIKTTPYEDRIILLTGHSRGGAVANIVAAQLNGGDYVPEEQLFCYTYASPNVTMYPIAYANIYNFVNPGDMVPVLPLKDWNYGRHGRKAIEIDVQEDLFRVITGKEYIGADVATPFEDAFKQIAPMAEDLEDKDRQILVMLLAYSMGGHNDVSWQEALLKYAEENYYEILEGKAFEEAGLADYKDLIEQQYKAYESALNIAYRIQQDTENMTPEEFEEYKRKNSEDFEIILEATGMTIATVMSVHPVIAKLLELVQYADEVGSILADLYFLVENTGSANIVKTINDAHLMPIYMAWANHEYYGYEGRILDKRNIRVPDDVLTIGPSCFEYSGITSFSANNVVYIGDDCFHSARSMESAVIPDSVTYLGSDAFVNCSALKDVTLPIEQSVFGKFLGCSSVETITYTAQSSGVMPGRHTINASQWDHYNKTLEYACRNSVKKIVYGEGVTSIANYANYHDPSTSKLTEITFPSTLKTIREYAFYGTALPSPMLVEGIEEIGSYAFAKNEKMATVHLPSTVTAMGDHAFSECWGLKEITFDNAMIGEYCFAKCTGLETLVIPNHITSLGDSAFDGCTGLKAVTLPIEQSRPSVFTGCTNVETITYTAQSSGVMPERHTVNASQWDHYHKTLEYACRNSVKKIVYGEGVTSIANYANYHDPSTSKLTEITFPSTLKTIREYAFYGTALPSPMLVEGIEEIGSYAFAKNEKMASVRLPSTVTKMGSRAFSECVGLKDIAFDNAMIGEYCFAKCTGLETLVIPNHITSLGDSAFDGCTGLKAVTLPIEQSRPSVFTGCTNVETITYTAQGNGVMPGRHTVNASQWDHYYKTLEYACRNSVKKIVYGEGVTSIANYANYHDPSTSKLTEITFPSTLKKIDQYAFYGCASMKDITFEHAPDDDLQIGYRAFYVNAWTQTNIFVPDAKNVHAAISGYDWWGNNREGTYMYIPVLVESIAISTSGAAFEKNVPAVLTVTVLPETITADQILWSVDREGVAAITQEGEITFSRAGFATVRAEVIGSDAFAELVLECEGDVVLTLPAALSSIDKQAFTGVGVEIVILPDGAKSIGEQAFAGCPNLYKVIIPDTVSSIADNAFEGSEYVTILCGADSHAAAYAGEKEIPCYEQ